MSGVIGGIVRRSTTPINRKEDIIYFWKNDRYRGPLSAEMETILTHVYNFVGYSQFLPRDIIKYDETGDVNVILDDTETKKVRVSLPELEKTLDEYKKELEALSNRLEFLIISNKNSLEIEQLNKKIEWLRESIKEIEGIINECGEKEIEIPLLGYYKRRPEPEIHLMMGSIRNYYELAIVLVHELMHAFFDKHVPEVKHASCPDIEEPLAEYGMLCFMEMFSRLHDYKDLFKKARAHVEKKKCVRTCNYGYGLYLFDDKTEYGADWVSLFRSYCPEIDIDSKEVKDYCSMISPVHYPQHERACEEKLYFILRPRRFHFTAETERCDDGRILFNVPDEIVGMKGFLDSYNLPKPTKIRLTLETQKHGRFTGSASVLKGSPNPSSTRINVHKDLYSEYARIYGSTKVHFALFESKPSDGVKPAEWIAREQSPKP